MTHLHSTRGSKNSRADEAYHSIATVETSSNLFFSFLQWDEPQSWVAQTMECQPDVVISEEELVALQRLEFAACEKSQCKLSDQDFRLARWKA
jgi:hypothetical protein